MTNGIRNRPVLRCLILGEEPIVARCGELLLERGHQILALSSKQVSLQSWADKKKIETLRSDELVRWTKANPFDLLLSITYPAIIPPEVFERAALAAINFHDGPLPHYAGLNASAWAIHNQEPHHAIVWHHITAQLDGGDILERRDLMLESSETSLSLNIRNSSLALESFQVVIERAEEGELQGVKQDLSKGQSIYSRHDRPLALGVIDCTLSAQRIDALIRSCDFGKFANAFASAKLVHQGRCVVVAEAHIGPTIVPGTPPGKLSLSAKGELSITCADRCLIVTRLLSQRGVELNILEGLRHLQVVSGDILAPQLPSKNESLGTLYSKSEAFYIRRLGAFECLPLPSELLLEGDIRSAKDSRPLIEPLELPLEFEQVHKDDLQFATVCAFALMLSSLLRNDKLSLALERNYQGSYPDLTLVADTVPFNISLNQSLSFERILVDLKAEYQELRKRPGYLLDLIARQPSLREEIDLNGSSDSAVAVVFQNNSLPQGALLALSFAEGRPTLLANHTFSPKGLIQLGTYLRNLCCEIAAHPQNPASDIDCLTDAERKTEVTQYNQTRREYSSDKRIFDLFEEQAKERPEATALIYCDQSLTFKQLDRKANQLAQAIQKRGVGVGDYVGLMAERGLQLVIALLGIAKSGAAYVPIDAIYPQERALFMLQDAGCRLLVASETLAARVDNQVPTLILGAPEVTQQSDERVRKSAQADDVCYAIYTSGTTGRPKGVVLKHRAVLNTLDWINRTLEITPKDRLLFVTSPSFDLSVYDIFGALGAGATVEIASTELMSEPRNLAHHLCNSPITIWNSAPPALARLAHFLPKVAKNTALRHIMLSGDWIPVDLPGRLTSTFTNVQVTSLGGATEAAIWSNYYPIDVVDPQWPSIPYGYPIQNARYYVLDHHLRPVPQGMPGDLYIGGICLAEGYLKRPQLTNERFMSDPFLPGERIYQTGDLCRRWTDGTLQFLGRMDDQVKIRGFRVEIGEIETALCSLGGVREAICLALRDAGRNQSLVAYIVAENQESHDSQTLKEQLAETLPDFMIPGTFVFLKHLPLTSNGKLDRAKLPKPEQVRGKSTYATPTTPLQRELTEIWQGVMGREKIGLDDNFFELGGHSLMAVSLVAEIDKRWNLHIPLSKVLEKPTTRALSEYLQSTREPDQGEASQSNITLLRPGGARTFVFIHDGDGEVLLYRNLAQALSKDFTVYGIVPDRKPGIALPHTTIEGIAASYVSRLVEMGARPPFHLAGLCAGGLIAYEMATQMKENNVNVGALLLLDTFEPRATCVSGRITRGRIQRFKNIFSSTQSEPADGNKIRQNAISPWRAASRKVVRALSYEVKKRVHGRTVALRLHLLKRLLHSGTPWPHAIPHLHIREIYQSARDRYAARPLNNHNVVLVKATRSATGEEGDLPMSEIYQEDLLGWDGLVSPKIHLLEVPGGHSSMLQEPYVQHLVHTLVPFLESKS